MIVMNMTNKVIWERESVGGATWNSRAISRLEFAVATTITISLS